MRSPVFGFRDFLSLGCKAHISEQRLADVQFPTSELKSISLKAAVSKALI